MSRFVRAGMEFVGWVTLWFIAVFMAERAQRHGWTVYYGSFMLTTYGAALAYRLSGHDSVGGH